jgi:hypothetical protein
MNCLDFHGTYGTRNIIYIKYCDLLPIISHTHVPTTHIMPNNVNIGVL